MKSFVTYEKMSKKKKREYNNKRRGRWDCFNPATRVVMSKRNKKKTKDIVRSQEEY